jgi:arsenate reductase
MAFPVTIYHNPSCSTSRKVLDHIRAAGYEPIIIEYLKTGWRLETLRDLIAKTGLSARALLRAKGTDAAARGLTGTGVSDDEIIAAMIADPVLVNRPIVATPKAAALCRPPDLVHTLLEKLPGSAAIEDGRAVNPR